MSNPHPVKYQNVSIYLGLDVLGNQRATILWRRERSLCTIGSCAPSVGLIVVEGVNATEPEGESENERARHKY